MKRYKITLRSRWGEPLIVTAEVRSLNEAMKKVDLASGWNFAEYSEIEDEIL
jgi:hypothetical protein